MLAPVSMFTNPATSTCYRLVIEPDGWRVSKSRVEDGRLRLVHLRGATGAGAVDAYAIDRLVSGQGGVARASAPMATFTAAVVLDITRAADVLTAVARESESVYSVGCRGFRPRSPMLRRQRDEALALAVAGMRSMAAAWRATDLVAEGTLPAWLIAALEDEV
jgi:hypothetical protein